MLPTAASRASHLCSEKHREARTAAKQSARPCGRAAAHEQAVEHQEADDQARPRPAHVAAGNPTGSLRRDALLVRPTLRRSWGARVASEPALEHKGEAVGLRLRGPAAGRVGVALVRVSAPSATLMGRRGSNRPAWTSRRRTRSHAGQGGLPTRTARPPDSGCPRSRDRAAREGRRDKPSGRSLPASKARA